MKYRADIDGLRALAIIPVILFHAGAGIFPGGFLGVDIFFVISGYLITTILLADLAADKFSIKAFYERRARRILPALFFMIALVTVCSWFILPPDSFKSYGKSAVAAILSVSNILFWGEADYFNAAGVLKPLLHTWSLGIEEQFYIFFPIGLFLVWKFARPYLELVLISGFLGSLALAEFMLYGGHITGNFYLLPFRAWELIAGGYVAYRHACRPFNVSDKAASLLSAGGFVMALGAMMVFHETMRHPGVQTLFSVVGAGAVIAFGATAGLSKTILSHKIPVWIGLISYSLYLWHQPVFSLYRYYSLEDISAAEYAGLVVLSVVLAVFTYKFIETPFRNRQKVSVKTIWLSSAAVAIVLIAITGYAALKDGIPGRFDASYDKIFVAQKSRSKDVLVAQDAEVCKKLGTDGSCLIGDASVKPTWALIGDSHAASLGVSLDKQLKAMGQSGYYLPRFGCVYVPGMTIALPDKKERCRQYGLAVRQAIQDEAITHVVMLNRYTSYYDSHAFNNGEGGIEVSNEAPEPLPEKEQAAYKAESLAALQTAVTDFTNAGIDVYLIYPVPDVGWDVPLQMFKLKLRGLDDVITTRYEAYLQRNAATTHAFDSIPDTVKLHRIRPDQMFCNTVIKDRCVTQLNGQVLYFDDDHLSIEGSDLMITEVMKAADTRR